MLNTLSQQRPWYYPLIAWFRRLTFRRQVARPAQVATVSTERLFPISEEQAHLFARSADDAFYQERIVSSYQYLPPVRMREYRPS